MLGGSLTGVGLEPFGRGLDAASRVTPFGDGGRYEDTSGVDDELDGAPSTGDAGSR